MTSLPRPPVDCGYVWLCGEERRYSVKWDELLECELLTRCVWFCLHTQDIAHLRKSDN